MPDLDATAQVAAADANGSTRRELVRSGLAAGAAAAAAALLPPLLSPAGALAAPIGDAAVLVLALRAEQAVLYAYEGTLASGVISASTAQVLKMFLGQEHEHVDALTVHLERLGGTAPAPPSDLAAFELLLRELQIKQSPSTLRNEREYLSFLVKVEAELANIYHFAIEQLVDDQLIQTAAQIMANEGQHATLLRELISPGNVRRAVPRAFVGGAT
jgi:rubrerythrin